MSSKPPRRSQIALPATFIASHRRCLATVHNCISSLLNIAGDNSDLHIVNPDDRGPMQEYDDRVAAGKLRDDAHQRGLEPAIQECIG